MTLIPQPTDWSATMRTVTPALVLTALLMIATTACTGSPTQPQLPLTRPTPPTPPISPQIPLTNLVGSYTLTITASGMCVSLPEVARRVAYDAAIAVTDGALSAKVGTGGRMTFPDVSLQGTTVSMELGYWRQTGSEVGGTYSCPDAENQGVSDTETVSLCGTAAAQFDAAAMPGSFMGKINYAEWAPFNGNDHDWRVVRWVACDAGDHQFSLVRRASDATRRR